MSSITEISLMVDKLEADGNDFCDHEMELLEHRTWLTQEGILCEVCVMSHSQIRACMRGLRDHKNLRLDAVANMWLEVFELELTERQAEDENSSAPIINRRILYELAG